MWWRAATETTASKDSGSRATVEHVTMHPFDASTLVARPRSVEHGAILIEADDVPHARVKEFRSQHPVTTPDIQDSRSTMRE